MLSFPKGAKTFTTLTLAEILISFIMKYSKFEVFIKNSREKELKIF
jgi:hypothetical protein